MAVDPQHLDRLKVILFDLLPPNGNAKSNKNLSRTFIEKAKQELNLTLDDADYWIVRSRLLEEHRIERGRGKGGSVRRVPEVTAEPSKSPDNAADEYKKERDLYEPFHEIIQSAFAREYGLKNFVSQVTADQGGRATGGKWTRPDVTLIAVRIYRFIPGKTLEVVTFEVKPSWAFGVEGVFETAAHSVFANRSYLALHAPGELPSNEKERLEGECRRFKVGLITFADPKDWETYETIVEAPFQVPDPDEVDSFISTQISAQNREKLDAWVR
jgi:hypothetical protein